MSILTCFSNRAAARSSRPLHSIAFGFLLVAACAIPAIAFGACPKVSTSDLDGDCKSDIVFQNNGSSQVVSWLMNGTAIASSGSPGTPGLQWNVIGSGDFNGDGKADLLFRNSATSQLVIWFMNGTTVASSASLGSAPSSAWNVQGVGDFNGDGKADILWQNDATGEAVIWFMNGSSISSSLSLGNVPGWNVVGVGDFDGDGNADILWQNSSTAQNSIWLMNGSGIRSSGDPGSAGASWTVDGVGDFDGDGKFDILWQNISTGQLVVWLMSGTTVGSSGSPATLSPPWSVQQVGDFNGDGKSDISIYNNQTSEIDVWLMNGASISSSGSPGTPGIAWRVQNPLPYGVPVLARQVGYLTSTFSSDSFSTSNVDTSEQCVNNFTAGGSNCSYQWFPYRLFGANPSNTGINPKNCLGNFAFPGDGSVTLNGCATGPNGMMVTAVPNVNGLGGQTSGSSNYHGTAFSGGMYVELTAQIPVCTNASCTSFNGSTGFFNSTTGWPSFWFLSLEGALLEDSSSPPDLWAGQGAGFVHNLENDAMEVDGTTASHQIGSALHETYGKSTGTTTPSCSALCKNSSTIPAWSTTSWVSTATHKYGMLYVPATSTTSGYFNYYLDNVLMASSQSWTQFQNTGASPFLPTNMPANGVNGATSPSWLYGVADIYHYVIILGTGTLAPGFKIQGVNVWQVNSSGNESN